jgi:ribonuclease BN (tRNA processing enzyme)
MLGLRAGRIPHNDPTGEEPHMMEFVVLGSAGWIPQQTRMTTCLALRTDQVLLLFDAGTGLSRLAFEPLSRLVPSPDRPVHVFLTHLHLDHVVGLSYLSALWSNPTVIHLPPREVSGVGPEVFEGLFGGPFHTRPLTEVLPDISVVVTPLGGSWVDGHRVVCQEQDHPGGSAGYRVDDVLTFITDSRPGVASERLAAGVRILAHEAWSSERDDPGGVRATQQGHSSAAVAARVARGAGVGELLLSHMPPAGEDYLQSILDEARSIFPQTELCADGSSRSMPEAGSPLCGSGPPERRCQG